MGKLPLRGEIRGNVPGGPEQTESVLENALTVKPNAFYRRADRPSRTARKERMLLPGISERGKRDADVQKEMKVAVHHGLWSRAVHKGMRLFHAGGVFWHLEEHIVSEGLRSFAMEKITVTPGAFPCQVTVSPEFLLKGHVSVPEESAA